VNAASFGVILIALVLMRPIPPTAAFHPPVLQSVGAGLRYLGGHTRAKWLLALTATALFATGSFAALLPAVAGNETYRGFSWLSLMLAATGVGALVGSFLLMRFGRSARAGALYTVAILFNGAAIVLFALSIRPGFVLATAFAAGLGGTLMAGLVNGMLQSAISDEFRGRVMSVFSFQFVALTPAGQLLIGAIGSTLGIHAALVASGAVCFVVGLFGVIRVHDVREWRMARPVAAPEPIQAGALAGNVALGDASALR